VPENAENGDFGHTAPLTGPQIKGNFNKIGWQGERIACQCQFFSSLLGKQRVLKLKKPVNYVSLLNLDRTTTELVERIEPVNGFKPRLKVALGFTNWAYRLQICHCNRRTEWPNSDHSGSGKGNVHQRGASDPRSPWQRAYVERRVGTIRRAGSPAND